MRQTVARRIRRVVYGEGMSHRERTYLKGHHPQRWIADGMDFVTRLMKWSRNPTCICVGLRRVYRGAKSAHVRRIA